MSAARFKAAQCPWCRGSNVVRLASGQSRPCAHPGPIAVVALPGAVFRTTKFEVASGAPAGKHARPTWTPPKDVGRAFRKAIAVALAALAAGCAARGPEPAYPATQTEEVTR